jgi:hypothetical protein
MLSLKYKTEFMEARRAQPKAYLLMGGRFAGATATGTASPWSWRPID